MHADVTWLTISYEPRGLPHVEEMVALYKCTVLFLARLLGDILSGPSSRIVSQNCNSTVNVVDVSSKIQPHLIVVPEWQRFGIASTGYAVGWKPLAGNLVGSPLADRLLFKPRTANRALVTILPIMLVRQILSDHATASGGTHELATASGTADEITTASGNRRNRHRYWVDKWIQRSPEFFCNGTSMVHIPKRATLCVFYEHIMYMLLLFKKQSSQRNPHTKDNNNARKRPSPSVAMNVSDQIE